MPDPLVQDPASTQNFNRYSYCLNNPLKYTDESGEVVGTILTVVLRGVASIFGSACKATCSCSVLVLVSFNSIFAIMKAMIMKIIRCVLLLISYSIICSCTSYKLRYYLGNSSPITPLACVLNLDYANDSLVHQGDPYSTGSTEVWFKNTRYGWSHMLGDSVAIYVIDPSMVDIRILNIWYGHDHLTEEEAELINNSPNCILAKYYLSYRQFRTYGEYKYFPPDEKMKTTVRMWPSYEELVEKYSK